MTNAAYIVKKTNHNPRTKLNICHTWREDIWVEANVERGVADGAHGFTGVEDHLSTFGVCENVPQNVKMHSSSQATTK